MFRLTNVSTGETRTVSLAEAAEAARLSPQDIEWAIEEEGVCSTDECLIRAFEGTTNARETTRGSESPYSFSLRC